MICSPSENAKHFLELVLLSLTTSEMKTRASFKITGVHCMSALLHKGDLLHPRLPCGKGEKTIKKSAGRHFFSFFNLCRNRLRVSEDQRQKKIFETEQKCLTGALSDFYPDMLLLC